MTDLLFLGNQLRSSRVKKGVISKSIASNQQGMCNLQRKITILINEKKLDETITMQLF